MLMPIRGIRKQYRGREVAMYNYMIFNVEQKTLYKDFMAYYKRNECDELYFVSVSNPKLLQYLEEFIERRIN